MQQKLSILFGLVTSVCLAASLVMAQAPDPADPTTEAAVGRLFTQTAVANEYAQTQTALALDDAVRDEAEARFQGILTATAQNRSTNLVVATATPAPPRATEAPASLRAGEITRDNVSELRTATRLSPGLGSFNIMFSPNGRYVASSGFTSLEGANPTIRIWDAQSGAIVTQLPFSGLVTGITTNDDLSVIGAVDGSFTGFWRLADGQQLVTPWVEAGTGVYASRNGHRVATISDEQIGIFERPSGRQITLFRLAAPTLVADMAADGSHFVFADTYGIVTLLDATNGFEDRLYTYNGTPLGLKISPSGRYLALQVLNTENRIEVFIWDTTTRDPATRVFLMDDVVLDAGENAQDWFSYLFGGILQLLAFNEDETLLAIGVPGQAGGVTFVDRNTGLSVARLPEVGNAGVAFSPRGDAFAALTLDAFGRTAAVYNILALST